MSDNITVARPYAKAVFEFAIDCKQLHNWSETLKVLALIVEDKSALDFIKNPSVTQMQHSELLMSIIDQFDLKIDKKIAANFLNLLAENNRLQVLPDISLQYDLLRRDFEKTVEVKVVSYSALTKLQEQTLIEKLSKKLQRSVSLDVSIDKSLQGGAVIRAGHLVFDASVKTQIKKLNGTLAA